MGHGMPHFKAALDIVAVNDPSIWEYFHSVPKTYLRGGESGETGQGTDASTFPVWLGSHRSKSDDWG